MSDPIRSISQNNFLLAAQQEVSHDNTLSGNGTEASPLGVNVGNWTEVTNDITASSSLIQAGAWFFYYNKPLKLINIIGEIRVVGQGDVYELPLKYRPLKHFVVNSPAGTNFIDYTQDTGKFVARSGTNGYFSIYCTLPCTGE